MEKIATIGLDIAKSVFQVHGVEAAGEVVVRKRLSRAQVIPFFAKLPRCLIGIEACSTADVQSAATVARRLYVEARANPRSGSCNGRSSR